MNKDREEMYARNLSQYNKLELGEWFPLLGSKTEKARPAMGGFSYSNRFFLHLGRFNTPIHTILAPSNAKYGNALVPFDVDFSYIIDRRDYNLEERKEKQFEYSSESILANEHPNMRLYLRSEILKGYLEYLGYAKVKGYAEFDIDPELDLLIKAIKLQVEIPDNGKTYDDPEYRPGSTYQTDSINRVSSVNLEDFYPLEFGPLAYQESRFSVGPITRNGLSLFLPEDEAILDSIRARYIIEGMGDRDLDLLSDDPDSPKPYPGEPRDLPFSWLR